MECCAAALLRCCHGLLRLPPAACALRCCNWLLLPPLDGVVPAACGIGRLLCCLLQLAAAAPSPGLALLRFGETLEKVAKGGGGEGYWVGE